METSVSVSTPEQEITQKLKRPRLWPAILTLYVLAALIPECVATFNTAPRLFVTNPASFFFLTAFYGSANLLIRELMRRRPRSLLSLLLLGAAFGFINEGVIAGTWYTTVPAGYIILGGINWGWAAALTAFHTLYSVIIPLFLVETLYPSIARIPWLRRRGLLGFSLLFALTISSIFFVPTYRPERIVVLGVALLLALIATRLPCITPTRPQDPRPAPRLGRLRLAGSGGTLLFFAAIILVPVLLARLIPPDASGVASGIIILGVALVYALVLRTILRWSKRHDWGQPHILALITGALLPAILLSLCLPPMWRAGQPIVTLACLVLLLWTTYRQKKRAQSRGETPRP